MNLMIFEKLVDRRDRKKIMRRTKPNVDGYDYRLKIAGTKEGDSVSFLVVGDSGAGGSRKMMKYHVAEKMAESDKDKKVDLVVHVGDLVYYSGSKQGYPLRFIKTYQYWLKKGTKHSYKNMVFKFPFFPIYGNHDYYDFVRGVPILGHLLGFFSRSIGTGSKVGRVFEKAFIENDFSRVKNKVLPYQPGKHTRLPNRYYWFTHGPCAFYALDSNTLDQVAQPTPEDYVLIQEELIKVEKEIRESNKELKLLEELERKNNTPEDENDDVEDMMDDLLDLVKRKALLKKRLEADIRDHDVDQLAWLDKVLQHPDAAGKWKIVFMHHSLYSSESGHVMDAATSGMRENLREIFVRRGVNLVLSGHSHCFEWPMRTLASERASLEEIKLCLKERNICYLVSGGGGKGLRESILMEDRPGASNRRKKSIQKEFLKVAESKAYTATFKIGEIDTLPHDIFNFLRIEATPQTLTVFPQAVEEVNHQAKLHETFPVKVFTPVANGIQLQVKKLAAINVFKDQEPAGIIDPVA